jgi:hypothetical protein
MVGRNVEPITSTEWSELRRIQAKPPGRREDSEWATLARLTEQQLLWALDQLVTEMRPLIDSMRRQPLPAVERVVEDHRAPTIPEEPTVAYAKLPALIAKVSTSRSFVSAAARAYTRVANQAERACDRLKAVWASHTPTEGPEWKITAEFTVAAKPLLELRDELVLDMQYLKDIEDDLHQTSIALRAIKDLAT